MKSLLLVAMAAFGLSVLTTGCGGSSSSVPAKAPADQEGVPVKPVDPEKKKGRIPKGPE